MNTHSLNEIAYNILNSFRGGRSSHNEHLSLEQVKFAVKYYRAMFIRRDQERNFNRFRMFEQDLGEVPVETVDEGCLLKRTENEIPTPVRLKRKEAITHVGCDKYSEPIPLIDAHRSVWNQYNTFTQNEPESFYRNGYIYITNDISIQNINIRRIFEDPEEVFTFTSDNGLDIYDENSPFPIPSDMLEGITKGIIQGELSILIQSPNDTEVGPVQDGQLAQQSSE